jgi:hypothetical protein
MEMKNVVSVINIWQVIEIASLINILIKDNLVKTKKFN